MASELDSQIPTTKSRLDGIITTKDNIQQEILKLLKVKPCTPTHLSNHFHQSREQFSRSYLYPMRQSGLVEKVDGSNYYQLPKQKNTSKSIKVALRSEFEIFKTELFVNWKNKNHSKDEEAKRTKFANICMGITNKNFAIHPDNIDAKNWKEVVTNMVDATLQVAKYKITNNEPNWGVRQAIRHAMMYGLGITISETEGIELRISGTKPTPKIANLHITPGQIILAKELLKKKSDIEWFLKFGVKTWTFVRPSTIYLIELEHMEFLDQVVEYVLGKDGKKITDEKIIEYAKFRGDEIFSYARRICHIEVHEHKTDADFDKYVLDPDFVEPLEKFYNIRKSQRKKYLFWEDNNTEFTFENYNKIVEYKVDKDNNFFKIILTNIGFEKLDFGLYFRANYGFRHFGLQMWLLATDYNYDLVGEMSHEDTATLKKWYGKRTKEDFQRKIKGVVFA